MHTDVRRYTGHVIDKSIAGSGVPVFAYVTITSMRATFVKLYITKGVDD